MHMHRSIDERIVHIWLIQNVYLTLVCFCFVVNANIRSIWNILPKAATTWLLPTYKLHAVFPCRKVVPHILAN